MRCRWRARAGALTIVVALLGVAGPGHTADDDPLVDLAGMSLEDLMGVDVNTIDVLGTHTHFAGEWMIGYSFMHMRMDGNRDGTNRLNDAEVLEQFMAAPTDMDMEMHMVSAMYAPTDRLSLMAMMPYLRLSMDHVTRMGQRFTTRSEGPGDLMVGGTYTAYSISGRRHRILLGGALSFPTGSIDEEDDTPAGSDQPLPYPMQLGSGTFDLHPGLTYIGERQSWTWGGEAVAAIRFGKNANRYRLGDRYALSVWGTRKLSDWLGATLRLNASFRENIDGADPDLNPRMVPTADPDRQGGDRLDIVPGLNVYVPRGPLEGHRFALAVGIPIFQSLDGPQLEVDWHVTAGWSWAF